MMWTALICADRRAHHEGRICDLCIIVCASSSRVEALRFGIHEALTRSVETLERRLDKSYVEVVGAFYDTQHKLDVDAPLLEELHQKAFHTLVVALRGDTEEGVWVARTLPTVVPTVPAQMVPYPELHADEY